MVASQWKVYKSEDTAGLDRPADGERTCKSEAPDGAESDAPSIRSVHPSLCLALYSWFLVPTIPPARIGEYVSSGYQTDDHAFTGGYTATTPSRARRGVRYS